MVLSIESDFITLATKIVYAFTIQCIGEHIESNIPLFACTLNTSSSTRQVHRYKIHYVQLIYILLKRWDLYIRINSSSTQNLRPSFFDAFYMNAHVILTLRTHCLHPGLLRFQLALLCLYNHIYPP